MDLITWAQQNAQTVLAFGGISCGLFIIMVFLMIKKGGDTEKLQAQIKEQAKRITDKDSMIAELQQQLKQKDEEIAEKDAQIKEVNAKFDECDQKITEQAALINEKEAELLKAVRELEEYGAKIATLAEEKEAMQREHDIAILYTRLKDMDEEFYDEFTQNILKGIVTMSVAEIDIDTAKGIFNMALEVHDQWVAKHNADEEDEEDI